jgi:PAS domain S-box-containing protein
VRARFFRFSPSRLAVAYIALSVLVLALFAIPLWYSWRVNISTFRAYVQGEDMQMLMDVFDREGPKGLTAAMDSQVRSSPSDEILVFADAAKQRIAGNLPGWPAEVPDAPGTYGLVIDLGGGSSMRVVASHVRLPGGYHLLMGRQSVRFETLVQRFWYGIAGAMGIILLMGAVIAWMIRRALLSEVHEISRTASAIAQGDLSRRVTTRGRSDELDTLARTVNGMLEQLARKNVQLESEISVRRQAEQALHRAHDDLEGLVAQRTKELERTNESLRRSETCLAEAQRLSHTGSFSWRPASGEIILSEETYQIYEYSPDTQPTMELARERVHPDDRAFFDETARRVRQEQNGFEFEHRLLMPRGFVKHLRVVGRTAKDESGKFVEIQGAVMDMTAQRLAQQSLERALQETQTLKQQFQLAIDTIPGLVWSTLPDGHVDFLNQRWREYTGFTLAQASGWGWQAAIHPDDVASLVDYWGSVLASGTQGETEARLRRHDGKYRWFLFRAVPLYDESGKLVKWYGTNTDIEDRKRAEALLAAENATLEMIAKGNPLSQVLEALCRLVEEMYRGSLCSILLLDPNGKLRHGAAPSLPESFVRAIDGSAIGERAGSCGTAAFRRARVIVEDITSDPLWADYRSLAAGHGLRACWSVPILTQEGKVLGTFAIYYREPGSPDAQQLEAIEQLTHLAGIAIERMRAEEELRRSETYLAEAQRLSLTGSFGWNVASGELLWSDETYELVGLDRGIKPTLDDVLRRVHPEDLWIVQDMLGRATREREALDFEHRFLLDDGSIKHVHVRARAAKSESGALEYVGAVTDVTALKRAEALLAGEKRLLEFVAKGNPLSQILESLCRLVEHNISGCLCGILLVDPSGNRLEYGAAPSLPSSYNEGVHGTPVNLDSGPCAMAAFLNEQVIATDIATDTRWSQQQWSAHALAHGLRACWSTPITSSAGKVFGTFALSFRQPRSPTPQHRNLIEQFTHLASIAIERAQAEDALRRSERDLRQAQRLEAMGTLAGGIAHDFNNILGAVLGYGEMALRNAPKGSRLRRDLDSIMTAGERGRALVDRILAFSRSGVSERIAVHVEKVVREALDLIEAKLPEGIRVETKLRAGRAAMLGDPTQVHQVLMNLGANAVQAMSSGGTLSVSLDAVHFDVTRAATIGTVALGDYIVLNVADSGSGIAPEILDRIFDPFFTTKEVGVGTGLGLSLVHGIVAEVGGAIDVTSTPGAGSVFTVYLPRAGEATADDEAKAPALPRGNGEQVLIVDDEEALVRLTTETLAELGYVPVGFTSSVAALEAFRAHPERFDAVITDERMPGMSGSELISEARAIRGTVPILLVSGYLGAAVVQGARDAGADALLNKPLSARELATSLARVLHSQ